LAAGGIRVFFHEVFLAMQLLAVIKFASTHSEENRLGIIVLPTRSCGITKKLIRVRTQISTPLASWTYASLADCRCAHKSTLFVAFLAHND
jgi:hypothetical protein